MAWSNSPRLDLSRTDWKKIGKGALMAGGGAVLTYLLEILPNINLGEWTPTVVAILSILLNAGIKFFTSTNRNELGQFTK